MSALANSINLPFIDRNVLVAGSSGCGKSSLIFTLTRGLFPGDLVPGRFEGLSLAAAATPKDAASNEAHSKNKATNKPYFVNLTFWEDRPRLNLWEKSLQKQRQLEKERKEEQEAEKSEKENDDSNSQLHPERPSLQRRSSQVSYATVNGVTVPNYYHASPNLGAKPPTGKKSQQPATTAPNHDIDNNNQLDEKEACCMPRPFLWPAPDVIVLCFSIGDLDSMAEAETVIWPELKERYPGVPIVLVGTKCDDATRSEEDTEEFWPMDEGSPNEDSPTKFASTTAEKGLALAQKIGSSPLIECSALENRGLRHIVEEAVWLLNSAVIASSETSPSSEAMASSLNNAGRKWSLSSSYPSSKSSSYSLGKPRKSSDSVALFGSSKRKISTTSTGSGTSYTSRPNICVQDPFSTSLPPTASSASSGRHRKQSYGAAVRKMWQNVSPK